MPRPLNPQRGELNVRMLLMAVHSPDRAPSQRFRIEEFLPYLRQQGIETDYGWALSADEAKTFYSPAPLTHKARVVARAGARRVWSVLPQVLRRRYDVVFVQREAFFLGGPWFEWLSTRRAPMLYDFDDAIWVHQISASNRRFAFLKNVDKVPDLVRMAHTVLAGNPYLAQWAGQYSSNVKIVPTTIDTEAYTPGPRRAGEPVTIGWSGSTSTIEHFETALPVLTRVKAQFGDRVRFKVIGDAKYRHDALGIVGEAWRADTEVEELRKIDVGLMPLPDTEWARGKCGLKGLQYMSLAIPTVMSPVGVNADIIRHGHNGFLASAEDEWVARLTELVESAELRARLGDAGRQTVVDSYSVQRWRDTYVELIRTAAGSAQ